MKLRNLLSFVAFAVLAGLLPACTTVVEHPATTTRTTTTRQVTTTAEQAPVVTETRTTRTY